MSRARNLAGFGSAITNPQNPVNVRLGVVTAIEYYGDGSNLTGTPGGLGTSLLPDDLTSPLNKIYYTNANLTIGSTITVDPPASASAAYTQYTNIVLTNDADLIIADGDDFIPDILGIGTDVDTPGILADGQGKLRVDNITNKTGTKAPKFPYGLAVPVGAAVSIGVATEGKPGLVGIDTTTGIFFPTTGEVAITNSGSESLRINSVGNLGLGVDPISPGHTTLHLHESSASQAVRLQMTTNGTGATASDGFTLSIDGSSGNVNVIQRQNADMLFYTATSERLRITSGGQIQVGAGNTLLLGDSSPTNNTVYNYESAGNGAIKKYYITDNLNSGESTRFSFSGTDRTCAMITINAVGSWTSSNTASNHVAAQFMCRVFTNSSGDSADSTTVTTPFAYTYSTSNYTFTNSGSFGYTIDIANPTGDDGVTFFYEVIMHMGNPFSGHTLTASSTV